MSSQTAILEPELDRVRDRVNALKWAHSIDLGRGVVTPGKWGPPSRLVSAALDTIDFKGATVLDIGCWDGLWSFEAERRGAREVYSTDYSTQRSFTSHPTYVLAHEVLGSRARYHPNLSVYDVGQLGVTFDVVLFCGVHYHLRDPLLALARLRRVLREGGVILVEGEVLRHEPRAVARFFYRDNYRGDHSNWWVPSRRCLREWVESSYFEIMTEHTPRLGWRGQAKSLVRTILGRTGDRHAIVARAVSRADPKYMFPDDELRAFDRKADA